MKSHMLQTVIVLVVLLTLTTGGIWPATAQDKEALEVSPDAIGQAEFKPGEILIKFEHGASVQSMQSMVERQDIVHVRMLYGTDSGLWSVPEGQEMAIVEELNANPAVAYAEPNYVYHVFDDRPATPLATPNDPRFGSQWGHTIMESSAGWNTSTGSSAITIAIIDTGVDLGHPDLAGKLVPGYDFVQGDSDPTDRNGHGTHVAGIAAAVTNNGIGVAGMDWQAKIMPVVVATPEGAAYTSDIVSGVYWAYQHGAKVLNLSLGGPEYSQALQDALTAAFNSGSLVVAAMGNYRNQGNPINYPAANAHVMAVAATGPADVYASYSQYGEHCDISAPGGDMSYLHDPNGILSTMPTYPVYLTTDEGMSQDYDYNQGTSMASPYVAGLAALVWSTDLNQSPTQVQATIQDSADDLGAPGRDQTYGYGRINVRAALATNAVPVAPALLPISNSDGDGSYVVAWSMVAGASSYTLQEDDNVAFSSPSSFSTGTNTSYPFVGKARGTTWYYRVRASNASGNSPLSNVESVTVTPSAPTLVSIDNVGQEDEYLISWSAVSGATSYTLWQSASSTCSSPIVRYSGGARQYQVTGQAGGTWYYCVLANNAGGSGPRSAAVSTTVAQPALDPPVLAPIDNPDSDGLFVVQWGSVPTAPVTYVLEQSDDFYFVDPSEVYRGSALSYPVSGHAVGTWHYRVRAFGADGKSPWSSIGSTVVKSVTFLPSVAKNHTREPIVSDWETIVSEDFEGSFPTGIWDVVDNNDPEEGRHYWSKRDCQADSGGSSAWAIGDGLEGRNLSCNSLYPDLVDSWMVYGPFSLVDATNAELRYMAWLNVFSDDDRLCHMASVDGGYFAGNCTTDTFPQRLWAERVFDLTNVYELGDLRGEPEVWLAVIFNTNQGGSFAEGAHVDDMLLRKQVGTLDALAQRSKVTQGIGAGDAPAEMTRAR